MRPILESAIERRAAREAEKLGVRSIKICDPSQAGWPDRMFFIPGGRPLLIEFKRPGEEPRDLQEHRIEILNRLGYDVCVCDSVRGALAQVARALDAASRPKARRQVLARERMRDPCR